MACLNTSQKIWVQEKVLAWKRQKDFWIGRILHLLVPKFFSTRSDFVAYVKVGFCSQQVNFFWIRSKFAFFWPFLSAMSFLSSLFCSKYISWRLIHKVHTKKVSKLSPNHTFRFFASPEKFYFLRISTLLRKRQNSDTSKRKSCSVSNFSGGTKNILQGSK